MTDENSEKSKSRNVAGALIGLTLLGGAGAVGLAWGFSSMQESRTPLTERINKAYEQCQKIEDKSQLIEYVSYQYATCKEIEDLYLKVKN